MTAYGDRAYRAARAVLARDVVPCWRCGARATTPDHVPALAEHTHVPGTSCCQLRPSCAPCNLAAGAAIGNRRRRAVSRTRLTPGGGWSA